MIMSSEKLSSEKEMTDRVILKEHRHLMAKPSHQIWNNLSNRTTIVLLYSLKTKMNISDSILIKK